MWWFAIPNKQQLVLEKCIGNIMASSLRLNLPIVVSHILTGRFGINPNLSLIGKTTHVDAKVYPGADWIETFDGMKTNTQLDMIDNILIISLIIILSFDRFFIWFIIQQLPSSCTVHKPCISSLLSSLSLDSVTKNIRNIWTMQALISRQTRVFQVRWISCSNYSLDVHSTHL